MTVVKRTEISVDRTSYPDMGETWKFTLHENGQMSVSVSGSRTFTLSMSDTESSELFAEWRRVRDHER